MKKKFLLQIMGAVMVAGLMTGCGAKNDISTEQKTETVTETAEDQATDESTEESVEEDTETDEAAEQETEEADTADAGEADEADEKADSADDAEETDSADADAEEDAEEDNADAESAEDTTDTASSKTDTAEVQSVGTEAAATDTSKDESADADTTATDASSEEFVFTNTDPVTTAGWTITLEDVEKNASLENVSVQLGYTGVETSDYQKEAEAGKTFCLIKMAIKKDGSKETFQWDNLKLTDGSGNEYTRMEDEFLTDLGMTRMPGTALNFGSNEGWIAFEIDENATDLVLSYQFASEEYSCELK